MVELTDADGSPERQSIETTDAAQAIGLLHPGLAVIDDVAIVALSLMLSEPATEPYLEIADPPEETDEPLAYLVRGTRIFINSTSARDLRADVLTALAVWAASGSTSLSTGAALLRKVTATVKVLDEPSRDLFVVVAVASAARGGRPATWGDVVNAYDDRAAGLEHRLERLVRRDVLARHPDGWTVVP